MQATEVPDPALVWTPLDSGRLHLCSFLALATSDPRSQRWARLERKELRAAASVAAASLAREPSARPPALAHGEREPATLDLTALLAALRVPRATASAEYDRVFGLVASKECPAYETDYCPQTFSVYRSQQMADIAGFYAAFGLEPSRDMPERPDHIALELEFLAWLLVKQRHALRPDNEDAAEQARLCRDAQQRFVQDHLAWWLPAFARALLNKAGESSGSYLGELAKVLSAWIPTERAALGIEPPTELAEPRPAENDDAGCATCSELAPQTRAAGDGQG